jgi:hypothetical protein
MNMRTIKTRLAAAAARMPTDKRQPRVCVVTSADDPAECEARIAEAEQLGDPIIEVTLFETPTESGEVLS